MKSSFKRSAAAKSVSMASTGPSAGDARQADAAPRLNGVNTGSGHLNDILGGHQQLCTCIIVQSTDPHTAYAELFLRSYFSQALLEQQRISLFGEWYGSEAEADRWTLACPWVNSRTSNFPAAGNDSDADEKTAGDMRIAWRYLEKSTVNDTLAHSALDQTVHPPESVLKAGLIDRHTSYPDDASAFIRQLKASFDSHRPTRILLHYPPYPASEMFKIMHALRVILRGSDGCTAMVLLPSHVQCHRLGRMADSVIRLESFSTRPDLAEAFTGYRGLLHIDRSSHLGALLPRAESQSVLRGLSEAHGEGSAGERNLAFKLRRRRLVVEALHLDIGGGSTGERRVPASSTAPEQSTAPEVISKPEVERGAARKAIGIEGSLGDEDAGLERPVGRKPKGRVAFDHSRSDLYEF